MNSAARDAWCSDGGRVKQLAARTQGVWLINERERDRTRFWMHRNKRVKSKKVTRVRVLVHLHQVHSPFTKLSH